MYNERDQRSVYFNKEIKLVMKNKTKCALYFIFWKDTGEKCQCSRDANTQTCSAHTERRSVGIGAIWYIRLEIDVQSPTKKEQQCSSKMNFFHSRFLQEKLSIINNKPNWTGSTWRQHLKINIQTQLEALFLVTCQDYLKSCNN